MALTQISTAGVKDDAVTAGKIPANAVGSSELADNAVDTAAINADAVTGAKIADDAINSEHYTDGSIDTAHIADGAVTGAKIAAATIGHSKIADESITLAKLSHGTSTTDGKFLRSNNGADPSFEAVTSTTINNNADNKIITGSGTANTLEAESTLLYSNPNLEINTDTSAYASVILNGNSGGLIQFEDNEVSKWQIFGDSAFNIYDDVNNASRLYIGSSGQVSIGTTTASSDTDTKLRVHVPISSSSDDVIELSHNTNGANKAGASFGLSIDNGGEGTNAATLTFATASGGSLNERMRIASNGEVGINITNPQAYASSGHGYNGLVVQAPSGAYSGITIKSGYNGGGGLMFSDGSGSTAELYNVALTADHINKRLNFYVDGSVVCRLTEHGFHPNPTDSAAANALDDYEEGTWTPTDGSGASISITNNNTAAYTKIGRLVYIQFDVTYASNSNSSNSSLGGLPFNLATAYGSGVVGWTDKDSANGIVCHVDTGSKCAFMDNSSSGSSGDKHLRNDELSGTRMIGTAMYLAAT